MTVSKSYMIKHVTFKWTSFKINNVFSWKILETHATRYSIIGTIFVSCIVHHFLCLLLKAAPSYNIFQANFGVRNEAWRSLKSWNEIKICKSVCYIVNVRHMSWSGSLCTKKWGLKPWKTIRYTSFFSDWWKY